MDGPRDYHPKSDRERQIRYCWMWNLNDSNELINETDSQTSKTNLMITKGEMWRDKLGLWDEFIYKDLLYTAQGTLLNIL